jgi:hypothetical protein
MNKAVIAIIGSIFSISCLATSPSFTEETYCSDRNSKSFIKELATDEAKDIIKKIRHAKKHCDSK